jgi:hypothetical protein
MKRIQSVLVPGASLKVNAQKSVFKPGTQRGVLDFLTVRHATLNQTKHISM